MYCSCCGKQIADGSMFCPSCGMKIGGAVPQQQAGYQQTPQYQQPQYQTPQYSGPIRPNNIGKLHFWCAIGILFCIPAAIYGYVKMSAAKKARTQQEADVIVEHAISGVRMWCLIVIALFVLIGFFA